MFCQNSLKLKKRAVWGSQSGGYGLNYLPDITSVAKFCSDFDGFLLGWRGLPVHSINIPTLGRMNFT